MPPIQDMTSAASASRERTVQPSDDAALLDALQHQVAVFARRAEQTRLGGVGQVRNSMDRAAYLLLNRLDQEGPMGVKALAAGMGIDSSTVTRQVAPLVDTGLVKRTSHPEDGRAVVLQLSARGLAKLDEVRSSRRALMAQVTADWTEDERDSFTTLLTRLNGAFASRGARLPAGEQPGTDAEPVVEAAADQADEEPTEQAGPSEEAEPGAGGSTGS
ncbi:MarR family winged helix-turn-helix transcriptional regulator [Streptomyces sp. NPDC096310]|uniref:MarR family winged helix-turn-helix transcriptional regulator n=1 Tax=Streptomyces sp. NPDC096310 TaxID=3366082 RepID=UPI00381AF2FB